MKTLSVLKKDLEFNSGLNSLIGALKTIAVSQYKSLEHRLKVNEKFLLIVQSFFDFIDPANVAHPFISPMQKELGVVAITSDSGLLGGLNLQVIARALSEIEKTKGSLIVIGERGKAYLRDTKETFVAFPGIKDEDRYDQAMKLRDYCMDKVLTGEFGPLKVVFPRPVSFTVQKVEVVDFLPFVPPALEGDRKVNLSEVILESTPEDVVEYLVYLWAGQKFYEIFGLSRLAEFAARYVHLEESLQRLKEVDNKTRLEYFRVRHELVDRNMRELFAARLLYAGS